MNPTAERSAEAIDSSTLFSIENLPAPTEPRFGISDPPQVELGQPELHSHQPMSGPDAPDNDEFFPADFDYQN